MSSSGEKRGSDALGAPAPGRNTRSRGEPASDDPVGSIGASHDTSSVTPAVPPEDIGAALRLEGWGAMSSSLRPGALTTPAPDSLLRSTLGVGSSVPDTSAVSDPRISRSAQELAALRRRAPLVEQLAMPAPPAPSADPYAAYNARRRSEVFGEILARLVSDGSPLLESGKALRELDPFVDPEYSKAYNFQETAADTALLLRALVEQYPRLFDMVPDDSNPCWSDKLLGVASFFDAKRTYSWATFRDMYPVVFPDHAILFVEKSREDEVQPDYNPYSAVVAERRFLENLGPQSNEYKCFYKRMCYLSSLASRSQVLATVGGGSGAGKARTAGVPASGPAGGFALAPPTFGYIPGSLPPAVGQPLTVFQGPPLPIDKVVSQVTPETITQLRSDYAVFRQGGGLYPRKAFFDELAWQRVEKMWGTNWELSETLSDTEWFGHLLTVLKGDSEFGSDDYLVRTWTLIEQFCPVKFTRMSQFVADMDAFCTGLQLVDRELKHAGKNTFQVFEWERVRKDVISRMKERKSKVALPTMWERICLTAQTNLQNAKTRNFSEFFDAFHASLTHYKSMLQNFTKTFGVDPDSLRPLVADTLFSGYYEQQRSVSASAVSAQSATRGGKGVGVPSASGSAGQKSHGVMSKPPASKPQKAGLAAAAAEPQGGGSGVREAARLACRGCGEVGHKQKDCPCKDHPNFNKLNVAWDASKYGQGFKEYGYSSLPRDKNITLRALQEGKYPRKSGELRCPLATSISLSVAAVQSVESSSKLSFLIPGFLLFHRGVKQQQVGVKVLLDTGALLGNCFLLGSHTLSLIDKSLQSSVCSLCMPPVDICSPVLGKNTSNCSSCLGTCTLSVVLPSFGVAGSTLTIPENEALVVDMEYDLIIGLQAIVEYDLLLPLRQFLLSERCRNPEHFAAQLSSLTHATSNEAAFLVASLRLDDSNAYAKEDLVLPKEFFFGSLMDAPDGTENVVGISDFLPSSSVSAAQQSSAAVDDDADLPRMMGDSQFHHRIRSLCREFRDIFSRVVTELPAKVMPFRINANKREWQVKAHTKGPRPQSPLRDAEIKRQVQLLLELGVIRRAESVGHYSQVLLTPKPHSDKWRMCIDYRVLNSLTVVNAGYPIPHIPSLLQRLGEKRFKYAGKMDFVSGYHQAELDPETAELAAFVTSEGVFVPVRVMFGLCSAPSYFHGQMATTVLGSVLHRLCELFMDDVITWGGDEEEFLRNLRAVFERLRACNIKVHPDKCELGVPELEFVGHVINSQGLSMSEEKVRKVLNFELPSTVKELRSFVGLCNYFSEHIPRCSELLSPLHKCIKRTSAGQSKRKAKQTSVQWSEHEKEAFQAIKRAIEACATLFFLNDEDPVDLATDASDYGIGAEVSQWVNGKKRPIRFMSHSLSEGECRWSTIEKECYAIFRAFMEFAFLLRDRKFRLLTDHRNLTFLANPTGSKATSEKVTRWRLAIQEYMFDVLHVPGPQNIAPDSFSRLVPRLLKPHASAVSNTVVESLEDQQSVSEEAGEQVRLVVSALQGRVVEEIPDHAYDIIKGFHNELVGHLGVDRTVAMLTEAGFAWERLRSHVRAFIQQCPLCQKLSYVRPTNAASPSSTGGELKPMDRWCVDALEVVETESGYKFVLAFLDCFTRWVELYAVKSLEAVEAAKCLIDLIGRYGAPRELLSDRGSQFVNDIIAAVLHSVGSSHVLAMAYSHEENGRIERANKEILRHLRAFVMHSKVVDDWVDKLPFVQRIMNASVHTVTGYSPAALLFGKAVDLNRGIFPESPAGSLGRGEETSLPMLGVDSGVEFFSSWVSQRNHMQLQVLEASAELQRVELERHLQSVAPDEVTVFSDGTWVLVLPRDNPLVGRRRTGDKLSAFWDGPMPVVSHEGNAYTLHDTVEDKQVVRHVTELKPFLFDPARVDPRDVARIDRREFLIETIVGHRGDVRYKSTLEFEVKWAGYSDDYNLWVAWKQLLHTAQLREYLTRVGLIKLLPKALR